MHNTVLLVWFLNDNYNHEFRINQHTAFKNLLFLCFFFFSFLLWSNLLLASFDLFWYSAFWCSVAFDRVVWGIILVVCFWLLLLFTSFILTCNTSLIFFVFWTSWRSKSSRTIKTRRRTQIHKLLHWFHQIFIHQIEHPL